MTSESATVIGTNVSFSASGKSVVMSGASHGSGSLLLGRGSLPADGRSATIEIWGMANGTNRYARVFDYGYDNRSYFAMSWNMAGNTAVDCVQLRSEGSQPLYFQNTMSPYELGTPYHISVVFKNNGDGSTTVRWARRNVTTGELEKSETQTLTNWDVSLLAGSQFYLGRSQFIADIDAKAEYDEVRVWNAALTEAQLTANAAAGPDTVPQTIEVEGAAVSTALWTDAAGDGDLANAANWVCRDDTGAIIQNGLPDATMNAVFTGDVSFQIPTGTTFSCSAVYFDNARLVVDCDWRGLDASIPFHGRLDLSGRRFQRASLGGRAIITSNSGALLNGGFERGGNGLEGWTTKGTVFTKNNDNQYLYVCGNGSTWCFLANGSAISQNITVDEDGEYLLSFKWLGRTMKTYPEDPSNGQYRYYYGRISVKIDGSEIVNITNNSAVLQTQLQPVELRKGTHKFELSAMNQTVVDEIYLGPRGNLEIDVPEDRTVENRETLILGGANTLVTKAGKGKLVMTRANSGFGAGGRYAGNVSMIVKNGVVRQCSIVASSPIYSCGAQYSTIVVENGAQFDVAGRQNHDYDYRIAGAGPDGTGALVNTQYVSSPYNPGTNYRGFIQDIILDDDATIGGNQVWGLFHYNYGANTLTMNGHTLTFAGTTFYGGNMSILDEGTVVIAPGAVLEHYRASPSATNCHIVVQGVLQQHSCALTPVRSLCFTSEGSFNNTWSTRPVITVLERYAPNLKSEETSVVAHPTVQLGNASNLATTLDLSLFSDAFSAESTTFYHGSTVTVNIGTRVPESGARLVSWTTQPESVTFTLAGQCANDGIADIIIASDGIYFNKKSEPQVFHTVTFNLGGHGIRTGDGELLQTVMNGHAAIAPVVTPDIDYTFTGWDGDYSSITNEATFTAVYVAKSGAVLWDASAYAQSGLVAHFDGIRNAGTGEPHSMSARMWKNLVSGRPDALFNTDEGYWTENGFYFNGNVLAQLKAPGIALGDYPTVQLVCDVDWTKQIYGTKAYPCLFGDPTNDTFAISYNNTSGIPTSNLLFKADAYSGQNRTTRSQFVWTGDYVTGMLSEDATYLFNGTERSNAMSRRVVGAIPAIRFSWGGSFYDVAEKRYVIGEYHSVRMYNRNLTEAELARNRRVDEIRFHHVGADIVVATEFDGLFGTEPCGVYTVNGAHAFTAPATTILVDGCVMKCSGYTLDAWDATLRAWTNASESASTEYTYVKGDFYVPIRLTWKWKIANEPKLTRLEVVPHGDGKNTDMSFTVTCGDPMQTNYVYFVARDEVTGTEYPMRSLTGMDEFAASVYTNGTYCLTWNASADLPAGIVDNIRIHAFAAARPLAHRWGFNGNYLDTAGAMDATTTGAVTLAGGKATLAGGSRGTSYITLGQEVFPGDSQPRTIELWARQDAVKYWGTIFMVGVDTSDFLYMQWTRESNLNADKVRIGGATYANDQLAPYSLGVDYHIAMTLEPLGDDVWNAWFYKQDNATGSTLAKVNFMCTNALSLVNNSLKTFYLGYSLWSSENDASATYDEVRVWNAALRESELTRNVLAGKDVFTNCSAATSVPLSVVTFDLGDYATRTGGGELVQVVANGGNAIAPEVTANFGWLFAGWLGTFSNVTASISVTALYDSAFTFDATNAMDGVAYEGTFGNLTGMENITWSANGLPEGLTLSTDGTLSGTVLTTGTFTFSVMATAPDGASRTMPVSISVAENPNHRPIVSVTGPAAMPNLTMPGDTLEFNVTASDPDGDALSYVWLIDGVTNVVNTTGAFTWTPEELDGGTRIVTCLVTDGFWYIPAGNGWRVSIPKWYVSGDGVSTNAGTTSATPFREIQSAVVAAAEGDVIFVAEGVYGPINTANKKIRVIATGGLDKTIIDGGGTNRCVFVGDDFGSVSPALTNSLFRGFTIRNGIVLGNGGGTMGGTFDRCVFQGNSATGDSSCGGGACHAVLSNCLLTENSATRGGGADCCILYGCTVASNTASNSGGGTHNSSFYNSIVWDNSASGAYSNNYNSISVTIAYSCTAPSVSGTGNINTNPYFTDPANGDYRLRQYSPCLDAGNNAYVVGESDLSGTNRVIDGTIDLGCYEGWVYLPAPEAINEVSAEDGRRIGIVRLVWAADQYARSYRVYRAETNIVEAATQIGESAALFYDDETATPGTKYWYWVKGVNPTGEGTFGANDSGWCLDTMVFGTNVLATATAGLYYSTQLEITGGSGHYTWKSGADDYDVVQGESTYLVSDLVSTGVSGDDNCLSYPLPFDFPFYGKSYNKVWVNSNGTLNFDGSYNGYSVDEATFKSKTMIAVFWKDLRTGSGGVGVSTNGNESITFLWNNASYYSGGSEVNASVTLYSDGTVLCSYGSGNASGAFVGVSAGDGMHFRYFNLIGTSLANYDDIRFVPQDVPGGLTLAADGALYGIAAAPGTYTFTVFVTDSYGNGATQKITLEVESNPNLRTVQFDLGAYGVRGGGGNLLQYVMLGEDATAPTVRSRAGWVFDGWNRSFTNISENISVVANYRSAYADLHVDAIDVTNMVASGESFDLRWILGNTGNPSFNGRMMERVSLVSASDENDVHVIVSPTFEGIVERDGIIERNLAIDVPLKGWEGTWHVRIQTAINPTMQEYAANNVTTTVETVEITAVPLPNLKADAISGDANFVPGETSRFSFATTNCGASVASAPWMDRIYLESVDSGIAVKVGDVSRTNNLDSASAINGEYSLTIPEFISVAGTVRVKVVADANGDVVESNDDDNVAYSVGTFSLGTNLYLTAASTSVYENVSGSGVRFTVRRSGPTTEAMTVTLGNSDATSASLPATVTIPVGSASAVFYVKPIDNATVEGPRTVTVSASAGDCRPASLALTILDNEVPKLTVTLDKTSIREGDGVILATVTRELVTDEPLTVYLTGASTSRCSYPSSVVIPAGEASVMFEISVPNNDTAQAAASLTLRASSSGYTSTSVSYTVEDDDVPGVTLSLTPEVVSEGAGAQAIYATLTRSDTNQIKQAVRIRLTASEANQLILPSEITIPKYTMAVRFAVGVVDNALDDGDREVTINGAIVIESCGCSGQPSNGDVIQAVVGIIDNDGPALALKADPTTMKEGFDPAGYLVLSHNSTLTEDLTVRLWVDAENEDEISIPETVTIHAGETSVRIPVATLDDGVEDGGQLVSVYVEDESDVFAPASTWVQVSDQNLPDLMAENVGLSSNSIVGKFPVEVSFTVANRGFVKRTSSSPWCVYVVTGLSTSLGDATRVASGTTQGALDVSGVESVTLSVTVPERPGTYRFAVVADPDSLVTELDEANNTAWSDVFTVTPSYTATVAPEKEVYLPGERIFLRGTAVLADGVTPAANRDVEVYVLNSPYRRTYTVRTDSRGAFEAEFLPVSGEGGHYTTGASYPNLSATAEQSAFDILGMRRTSTSYVEFDMYVGDERSVNVPIRNLSPIPLTGVTVVCPDSPEECELTASVPASIPGNGTVNVRVDVHAVSETPQDVNGYRKLYLNVNSDEGVNVSFSIYVRSRVYVPPTPGKSITLSFSPGVLNGNMAIGETQYREVVLTNTGKDATGEIKLNVPTASWLRSLNGTTLSALAPGESTTVVLELTPDETLTLNSLISGKIQARESELGSTALLSFSFTPVSANMGRIRVSPVDEYTYYQDGAPHVTGAVVTVSNPYTHAQVASGSTGLTGEWISPELPCGVYDVFASEGNHASWSARLEVEACATNSAEPFMTFNAVKYNWDVKRVEVDDTYEITLIADFVTSVPKPTVLLEVPQSIPQLNAGESYSFVVTAVNHGLISARNVRFSFPENFPYQYEFAVPVVEEIPAKSSVVVPVRIHVPESTRRRLSAGDGDPSGDYTPPANGEITYNPCSYAIMALFEYLCGPEIREAVARSSAIQVAGLACDALVTMVQVLSQVFPSSLPGGSGDPVPGGGGSGSGGGSWGDDWIDRLNEIPPYSQDYIMTNCIMGLKLLECLIDRGTPIGDFQFKDTLGKVSQVVRYGYDDGSEDDDILQTFFADLEGSFDFSSGGDSDGGFDLGIDLSEEEWLENARAMAEGRHDDVDWGDSCLNAAYYYFTVYRRVHEEEMQRRKQERESTPKRSTLLGAGADSSSNADDVDALCPPEVQDDAAVATAALTSIITKWSKLMYILGGDARWQGDARVLSFADYMVQAFKAANGGSTAASRIPVLGEAEREILLGYFGPMPSADEVNRIDAFITRWNRTADYWSRGIFTQAEAAGEDSDDFIDVEVLNALSERIAECDDMAHVAGGESIANALSGALRHIRAYYNSTGGDVCARVSLKFNQSVTIAREAFEGTLTVYNGHATTAMENVKLSLSVTDADGNVCNDLFGITEQSLDGFIGSSMRANGVSLAAKETGVATILFVPTAEAAPEVAKIYYFGGKMTYVDPFSGVETTVTLSPAALMVNPCPKLTLHYFLQQEVFGDDPFTPDVVEPSEPAELALLVVNGGAGAATRMTVHATQPEKVVNEKGLLVDFNLSNYEFAGSKINGVSGGNLLETDLGTVPAHGTAQAQWWLTSSVQGRFTGMSAQFTQINNWGNPKTCLIDATLLHPLLKSVSAGATDIPDFLVCENRGDGIADALYLDDGRMLDVNEAANASVSGNAGGARFDATLRFSSDVAGAWHGVVADPGTGRYVIEKVVDAGGNEVPLDNFWLRDRSIAETGNPVYGYKLNFFAMVDAAGQNEYVITFVAKPSDVPEVVAFEGVTDGAIEYVARNAVTVVISKPIDPATFTVDDLTLMKQGTYLNDLSVLTITPADDSGTRFAIGNLSAICSGLGRYELTVQCAGIADTVGQFGTVGKSVAWTYATAEAPYVIGTDGVPVRPVQSLDTISVTFSAPIKQETFTPAALCLNGVAVGSGVTIASLDASGTRFSVSGLSSVQTEDGEYTLVIDATAVAGLDDTPGVNTYRATWTRDTVAPVLQSLAHEDGLNGNEFTLTFSEDVTSESLTPGGATIKRNGASVALPVTASLRRVGDNASCQWVLSGIDSALAEDGTYELCFSADGVTDEAGNVASGSKSVSWTVDRTPPAQITDLAISPDGGFSDTDGITYTGELTVSGTLPEAGLTVEIIAKYVGGGETVLATLPTVGGDSLPAGAFAQNIVMPGTGNATLVVRLTDAAGNSSDSEKSVSVDGIALTGTLTGASDDEGVVTTTATLAFSAEPMESDVTFDRFTLTRDGEVVALEGVTFTKVDDTTFTLAGLDSLCSEDGVYVLTFNGAAVRKYTSGLLMSGSLVMRWRYENPDREPPTVTEVLFDGETPHEAYTNVFSSVSVTFSEAVNVPELIEKGLIGRAVRIDLLDAANSVTGSAVVASAMTWNGESNTLSWQIDPLAVLAGGARLTLDAGLIVDLAGNQLSVDGYSTTNGMRIYTLSEMVLAQVNAQAMPMWYNGELYVGEKTADNKGKIRHYTQLSTQNSQLSTSWSYLQSDGVDIEIPAQGCQGASVAFADMDGDGAVETYIGTTGGDVLKYPGGMAIASLGANRAMPYAYDINGDGCEELVAGGMDGRIRVISRDAATGTYSTTVLTDVNGAALTVPNGRAAPIVADINHDGLADIVSGDTAGNVWACLGVRRVEDNVPYQGGGLGLTALPCCATPVCVFTNSVGLADRSRLGYGDVNGDGIEDIIVGRSNGSVAAMLGAETPSPIVPFAVKAVVSASAGAHGAIAPVGDATYDGGDVPEYTITADVGYNVADVQIDGASIGATNNYVFAPLTTSHTIHADFATIPYAITYAGLKGATNTNPETYTVEDEITFTAPGEVYGWVFKGWTPASIALGSTGAIEVTANWERQKFDVTVNGETTQYDYEAEVTFTAPEPWDADGMQVVTLGTTFTDPVVTNEFTVTVTNGIEFAWDILATNWWFEVSETQNGSITAPDAGWMADSTNFTLVAVPAEHYHFVGWTGDTNGCTVADGALEVTMDQARTIGAVFAIDAFTVTFEAGAHGSLAGETAQTIDYGGTAVVPTVTPDAGYTFAGWSGDTAAPIVSNATFTAQYATIPYAITYTGLKGATNTNPETYTVEDEITFTAPGEVYGWVFKGWTPASIALGSTGAIEVTANWGRAKFDVTVNGETKQYNYEDEVTFTAPEPWDADGIQVVTLGTTFTDPVVTNEFTVTVTNGIEFAWDVLATNWWFEASETQDGSITAPEAGWMADGTNFTLVAVPDEHYHFVGWTGDTNGCAVADGALEVAMDQARTIGAAFAIDAFTVTFEAGAHGTLSGETAQTIDCGATAVVPGVTPDAGYEFVGWSGDVSTPVTSNATFVAQYATIPYTITYTGLKGAANTNPEAYTVEDAITFAAPGEVYGWVFKGWTPASVALGSTGAIEVTANWERAKFDVTVGGGAMQYYYEDVAVFATNAVINCGATQYVCKGWAATNADPESGEGARAEFRVLGDVALDWQWETNVVTLSLSVNADSLVWTTGGATGWQPEWSDDANDGLHHAHSGAIGNNTNSWIETSVEGAGMLSFVWKSSTEARYDMFQFIVDGEVKGAISGETPWMTNTIVLAGGAHTFRWNYRKSRSGTAGADTVWLDSVTWTADVPPTLAEALNPDLFWMTDGDVEWTAVRKDTILDLHDDWATVGGLSDYESSLVGTEVYGAGVLTFDWSVSCEDGYDWFDFIADGEIRESITGEVGWKTVTIEFKTAGKHVLQWEYWKDDMDEVELAGDNRARLDNVRWTPVSEESQYTTTTPDPVPFADIRTAYSNYWQAAEGDYEVAAHMIGRNGYAIWESYVAGLAPDDEKSRFTAKIEILPDGTPKVTWEPDTPELRATREYTIYGRKTLTDGDWTPVTDADRDQYNFFKVGVRMK